jgi:hypothetical protein
MSTGTKNLLPGIPAETTTNNQNFLHDFPPDLTESPSLPRWRFFVSAALGRFSILAISFYVRGWYA